MMDARFTFFELTQPIPQDSLDTKFIKKACTRCYSQWILGSKNDLVIESPMSNFGNSGSPGGESATDCGNSGSPGGESTTDCGNSGSPGGESTMDSGQMTDTECHGDVISSERKRKNRNRRKNIKKRKISHPTALHISL